MRHPAANSSYPISREMSQRIDIWKVLLTVMVVFIHAYSDTFHFSSGSVALEVPQWLDTVKYTVSQCVCRCAVPGFFLISSVLLYRKPFRWWDNVRKKSRSLLIPYVLVNSFWILFYVVCQKIPALGVFFSSPDSIVANWDLWDWLHAYGIKTASPLVYPFWFLKYLFVLNVCAPLIKKVVRTVPTLSFLSLLALWLLTPESYLTQAVCFWGFGCFLVEKNIPLERVDRLHKGVLSAVYLLLVAADVYTRSSSIHNACILVGLVFWFACFAEVKNEKIRQLLLKLSAYSFPIYLFHELPLTMLKKICAKVLPLTPVFQLLTYVGIPLVILGCCLLLSILLERFLPGLYQILTGSRGRGRK